MGIFKRRTRRKQREELFSNHFSFKDTHGWEDDLKPAQTLFEHVGPTQRKVWKPYWIPDKDLIPDPPDFWTLNPTEEVDNLPIY